MRYLLLTRKFYLSAFLLLAIAIPLLRPAVVTAASPAENAFFCDPDSAALEAATGKKFNQCGQVGIWFEAFNKLLTGYSYVDYLNAVVEQPGTSTTGATNTSPRLTRRVGVLSIIQGINAGILEQKPASGIVFAADSVNKIIYPEATYAQDATPYFPGTGWALLLPIQGFWSWAVTLSYGFMIILIIIVAIALMFRAKLDGKTVVTLQNAIPNIVIAMIMIILSYPITGLFIDGITLGSNIFHGLVFSQASPARAVLEQGYYSQYDTTTGEYTPGITFNPLDPARVTDPNLSQYADPNARGLYADDPKLNVLKVKELIGVNKLGEIVNPHCTENATDTFTGPGAALLGLNGVQYQYCNTDNWYEPITRVLAYAGAFSGQNFSLASTVGAIINFLFSLTLLVVSVKIGFKLFKKFAVLTVYPVISPFIFASIAIPGQGTKLAWEYVNNLTAAVLNFIVTYIMFVSAIILASPAFHNSIPNIAQGVYNPPLIGSIIWQGASGATSRLFSDIGIIFQFLAAVILLNIPNMLESVDKRFKVSGELPKFLKDARAQYDTSFRTVSGITSGAIDSSPLLRDTVGKYGKTAVSNIAKLPGGAINQTFGRVPIVGGAAKALGNRLNTELGRAADPIAGLFTSKPAAISGITDKRKGAFKYSLELVIPAAAMSKTDAATDAKIKGGDYSVKAYPPYSNPTTGNSWPAHLSSGFTVSADLVVKLDDESKEFLSTIELTEYGSGTGIIGSINGEQMDPPTDATPFPPPPAPPTSVPVRKPATITITTDASNLRTPAGGTDDKKVIPVKINVPQGIITTTTFGTKNKIKTRVRGLDKDLSVRLTFVP